MYVNVLEIGHILHMQVQVEPLKLIPISGGHRGNNIAEINAIIASRDASLTGYFIVPILIFQTKTKPLPINVHIG